MARPRTELQAIFQGIADVESVWFQPDSTSKLKYPSIVYELDDTYNHYADDLKYIFKKRYQVTIIDQNPDSLIPDRVEQLPYTKFDRFFKTGQLNHFVYNIYF